MKISNFNNLIHKNNIELKKYLINIFIYYFYYILILKSSIVRI